MHRIQSLLHTVAIDNTDPEVQAVFIDPDKKIAMAGYRRIYGCGDCLVRLFINDHIDMGNYPNLPGTFYYNSPEYYHIDRPGLAGRELSTGGRERVDTEVGNQYFEDVRRDILSSEEDARFHVLLNPKQICDFIEERTRHQGMQERKINIQVFDGMNLVLGYIPGPAVTLQNGDPAILWRTPKQGYPGEAVEIAALIAEDSIVPPARIRDNKWYIFTWSKTIHEPDGQVTRTVRVISEYKPGIRMAIQVIPNGTLMPGDPGYNVYIESKNNIGQADILEMPFIEGQQGKFYKAPWLHIDVDTFYRALKPMEMFPKVEMIYKDSVTGVFIRTVDEVNKFRAEAIIGPTSPYKRGMVYTK